VTFSGGRRARELLGQSFARLAALAGAVLRDHDVANALDCMRRDLDAARDPLGTRGRAWQRQPPKGSSKAQATGSRFVVALLDANVELQKKADPAQHDLHVIHALMLAYDVLVIVAMFHACPLAGLLVPAT
jgi:hypothetical protein